MFAVPSKLTPLIVLAVANAVAVAEHVIAMFLSLSKSISKYDKEVRDGNFKKNADSSSRLKKNL